MPLTAPTSSVYQETEWAVYYEETIALEDTCLGGEHEAQKEDGAEAPTLGKGHGEY